MLLWDFQKEWLYIKHFYHSPFYSYAYSFGNLLVVSLYQQFKSEGKSFIPNYLNILSTGGSQKPEYFLKESEIDISKDEFWQQGFDLDTQLYILAYIVSKHTKRTTLARAIPAVNATNIFISKIIIMRKIFLFTFIQI
jgi:hypothetical protein